jgi:pimeloyl-[acyl-carrier protein] methyl ester esterase
LHSEVRGAGPEVVLVHGFALHAGVWDGIAERLASWYRVHAVDLPGHGRSNWQPFTIDTLAESLAGMAEDAVWIGWSLGGEAVLQLAARFPDRVRALGLVNTTPRFVATADWSSAMRPEHFDQFRNDLDRDWRATVSRFLSLQLGSDADRELLRQLRASLMVRGEPDPRALRDGLAVLEQVDLRAQLGAITAPALVLHGARDRLVPPAAGRYLAATLPAARYAEIAGAGHAPFLSHPEAFLPPLMEFLADVTAR